MLEESKQAMMLVTWGDFGGIFPEQRRPGYLILLSVCRGEVWSVTSFLVTARERWLRVLKFSFNLFVEEATLSLFLKGEGFLHRDTGRENAI